MCFSSLVLRLLCEGGEMRTWYILLVHAQLPQFGGFLSFNKIYFVVLISAGSFVCEMSVIDCALW